MRREPIEKHVSPFIFHKSFWRLQLFAIVRQHTCNRKTPSCCSNIAEYNKAGLDARCIVTSFGFNNVAYNNAGTIVFCNATIILRLMCSVQLARQNFDQIYMSDWIIPHKLLVCVLHYAVSRLV